MQWRIAGYYGTTSGILSTMCACENHTSTKLGHHGSGYREPLLLFIIQVLLSTVEGSLLDHSLGIYRHSVTTGEAALVVAIGSCQV